MWKLKRLTSTLTSTINKIIHWIPSFSDWSIYLPSELFPFSQIYNQISKSNLQQSPYIEQTNEPDVITYPIFGGD